MKRRKRIYVAEKRYVAAAPLCPVCGTLCDGARQLATNRRRIKNGPEPGDVSVCLSCAALLTYDENMKLVRVPREEADEILAKNVALRAARMAALELVFDRAARHGHGTA